MTATPDATRARRYLLGNVSDDEGALIEQEYLEQEEAVDRILAAEDELIEDYLSGQLSAAERERFERSYLSAPHHRVRVETVRRLMAHASSVRPARRVMRTMSWLALAASVLVVASLALWMLSPSRQRPTEIAVQTPAQQPAPQQDTTTPPPAAPRIFALTISPVAVRSAGENARVVIPSGTDVVVIRFESDVDSRRLVPRRASIQTIAGRQLWQGPATTESNAPAGTVARIDVPAASLPTDDLLVTLYGSDRAGVEREWAQYFLSVRAP